MALSAFDEPSKSPTPADVKRALGKSFELWTALQQKLALTPKWGFTSKSTGWGLRLMKGERVIVYLTPRERCFLASFALGEKAAEAARTGAVSKKSLALIEAAKKYAEGRGVRFEVKTAAEARQVEELVALKLAH